MGLTWQPKGLLAAWASRLDVKEADRFTRLTDRSQVSAIASLKGNIGPQRCGLLYTQKDGLGY